MKLRLKDRKHKSGKIFAEIIIKDKEVIRTRCLDSDTIVNGKKPDSDFRTSYKLEFLDKYHPDFKDGKIIIEYLIFPGTKYSAFVSTNFFKKVYLKLLFERYLFQRVTGLRTILIGIIIGAASTIIGGLFLNFFKCP